MLVRGAGGGGCMCILCPMLKTRWLEERELYLPLTQSYSSLQAYSQHRAHGSICTSKHIDLHVQDYCTYKIFYRKCAHRCAVHK